MTKLKLGAIPDDKPVKLSIELPADVHRDLVAYADVLARETGQKNEAAKLIAPMLRGSWRQIVVSRNLEKWPVALLPRSTSEPQIT